MGSSHAPDALVLIDMFPSISSLLVLLQYVHGILCSDGSVGIIKGATTIGSNCQILPINREFDDTRYIRQHSAAGTQPNVKEGRYSNGKLPQSLTFYGEAAGKVAVELAPFTLTKTQHFQVLFEMLNRPKGLLTKSKYLDRIHTLNSHSEDSILVVKNITPEWLAGMFDGDGGITVLHNEKAGRSRLELNMTQAKY